MKYVKYACLCACLCEAPDLCLCLIKDLKELDKAISGFLKNRCERCESCLSVYFPSEGCSDNCNAFVAFVPGKSSAHFLLGPVISLRYSERTSAVAAIGSALAVLLFSPIRSLLFLLQQLIFTTCFAS